MHNDKLLEQMAVQDFVSLSDAAWSLGYKSKKSVVDLIKKGELRGYKLGTTSELYMYLVPRIDVIKVYEGFSKLKRIEVDQFKENVTGLRGWL